MTGRRDGSEQPADGACGSAGESRSLSDIAYTTIKRAIIRCDLPPGGHVTESRLADGFGLSRASVRSALTSLRGENLVYAIARSGHLVAPITIEDVRQSFEVRMLLEPAAVKEAARVQSGLNTVRELESTCAQARYEPGDHDAVERFLTANTRFHVAVVTASGNHCLAAHMNGLLEEMERYFHLALQLQDRNDEMYHEHHDIVEALIAGDASLAKQLATEQIKTSEKMVMTALLSSPAIVQANLAAP